MFSVAYRHSGALVGVDLQVVGPDIRFPAARVFPWLHILLVLLERLEAHGLRGRRINRDRFT